MLEVPPLVFTVAAVLRVGGESRPTIVGYADCCSEEEAEGGDNQRGEVHVEYLVSPVRKNREDGRISEIEGYSRSKEPRISSVMMKVVRLRWGLGDVACNREMALC